MVLEPWDPCFSFSFWYIFHNYFSCSIFFFSWVNLSSSNSSALVVMSYQNGLIVSKEPKQVQIKHVRIEILDRTNYYSWCAQFYTLLQAHDFIWFLGRIGRHWCIADYKVTRSDEYQLAFLFNFIVYLGTCIVTHDTHRCLEGFGNIFASSSRERVMWLCRQHLDVKKASLSMIKYLGHIKNLIETIVLTG